MAEIGTFEDRFFIAMGLALGDGEHAYGRTLASAEEAAQKSGTRPYTTPVQNASAHAPFDQGRAQEEVLALRSYTGSKQSYARLAA